MEFYGANSIIIIVMEMQNSIMLIFSTIICTHKIPFDAYEA